MVLVSMHCLSVSSPFRVAQICAIPYVNDRYGQEFGLYVSDPEMIVYILQVSQVHLMKCRLVLYY